MKMKMITMFMASLLMINSVAIVAVVDNYPARQPVLGVVFTQKSSVADAFGRGFSKGVISGLLWLGAAKTVQYFAGDALLPVALITLGSVGALSGIVHMVDAKKTNTLMVEIASS